MLSDNGTQLVGAESELAKMMKRLECEETQGVCSR